MRSIRTSHAIVEAYLGLARENQTKPTATQLAQRAGCSARSIYERFGTIEALVGAAFDHILQKLAALPPAFLIEDSRPNRIFSQVRPRAKTCEEWLSVWQVLRVDRNSPVLEARIKRMHQLTREQLELVYRSELAPLSDHRRRAILIALEALLDFESWGRMREHYGLSVEEACTAWCEAIDELLPAASHASAVQR